MEKLPELGLNSGPRALSPEPLHNTHAHTHTCTHTQRYVDYVVLVQEIDSLYIDGGHPWMSVSTINVN